MTRRERLERKLQKRQEWAVKAEGRSEASFERAREILAPIPPGQPILVGHHSEKRHRGALRRHDNAMRKSCEEASLAKKHESKADGLERQLDRSIFSDDEDAIAEIQHRVNVRESTRQFMVAVNKAYRKGGKPKPDDADGWLEVGRLLATELPSILRYTDEQIENSLRSVRLDMAKAHWERQPYPAWRLSNLGALIRHDRERIEEIKRQADLDCKTAEAGGVLILGEDYINVRFSEKPPREILAALRAAGFSWGGGCWGGYRERLPACVLALASQPAAPPAPVPDPDDTVAEEEDECK